jgi:uncharacterized protein YlzI (FlbEa/FlbD family)
MEKEYYSLEINENNKLTRIIRILFGIVCLAVAIIWLVFNMIAIEADTTLWITIILLSSFGFYQIWAGLGYAKVFIEIGPESIRLKKNPFLPQVYMIAEDIEKIELFPLNMIFFLKSGKKIILRFGVTYPEMIEKIKDSIIGFSGSNQTIIEIKKEEI